MAQYALSCPALPTCGLALTEAERMQREMVGGFDALLARHGLADRRVSVRITGCPNGCARHLCRRYRHRRAACPAFTPSMSAAISKARD